MRSKCINSISGRKSVTGNGFSGIDFLYDVESFAVRHCLSSILATFHCACAVLTILLLPVKIWRPILIQHPRCYRASICEGDIGSHNSVCPSVRLSVCLFVCQTRCDKTKWCTADILIPHERAITLLLWHQQRLVGDAPFPLKSALKVTNPFEKRRLRPISAHNISTVGDSEKSSIMTNIKSTTG